MKTLDEVLRERQKMETLPVVLSSAQAPAKDENIFELQKLGDFADRYCLSPGRPGRKPILNGYFLFVVLASEPHKVYCGVEAFGATGSNKSFVVAGHTSLSKRGDVLYAGSIHFVRGTMKEWTNGSGHYLPPARLHHTNLLPALRHLLPSTKFREHISVMAL
ncbi:hypothetical protein MUU49_14320 [Scandinavium goeteborgense]|jgi:hypothetical protein|uniref:hypothetical protein n=1 Tax=Scandinavium goeteborgense TaxID=1851514 RepID=UPI0021653481|nr:hypothetical protein [Scandinavium goeteborgense]MCS2153731.1 hypothetical protein [Scandinavium goeteborgense]